MARIFISYSRVDLQFAQQLYELLQRMRPSWHIWYDQAPDGLLGGDSWWDEILSAIAQSDIFIYVLSNESVQSKYCQAEFEEARRLQKRIITIQARDRTKIQGNLADIQFIDIKNGVNDGVAVAQLSGALDRQASRIKKQRPLWRTPTPKPADEPTPTPRPDDAPDIDTPTIHIPHAESQNTASTPEPAPTATGQSSWLFGVLGVLVVGVIGLIIIQNMNTNHSQLAQGADQIASRPTDTPTVIQTDVPPETPRSDQPLSVDEIAIATINARSTEIEMNNQAIVTEQAQRDLQATATAFPLTQSAEETRHAIEVETRVIELQATLTTWTPTPTQTATFTPTPNATATLLAYRPQTNNDWTPVEREFDGVTMVLVPAGCFMMGSGTGDSDERPVHEQCFDAPFWIDKTEVTQAQFARLGGVKANDNRFTGDDRPVERITWFEARDFCELRGGRLPTEAEWEYAAGGVESWVYPWGDIWDGDHTIHSGNSNSQTADVGSRPSGASWVGALDMSGNVWDWTNSLYEAYPYDVDDGRERDTENSTDVLRVLRGGSWLFFSSDYLRVAVRGRLDPHGRSFGRGFRCVLS